MFLLPYKLELNKQKKEVGRLEKIYKQFADDVKAARAAKEEEHKSEIIQLRKELTPEGFENLFVEKKRLDKSLVEATSKLNVVAVKMGELEKLNTGLRSEISSLEEKIANLAFESTIASLEDLNSARDGLIDVWFEEEHTELVKKICEMVG